MLYRINANTTALLIRAALDNFLTKSPFSKNQCRSKKIDSLSLAYWTVHTYLLCSKIYKYFSKFLSKSKLLRQSAQIQNQIVSHLLKSKAQVKVAANSRKCGRRQTKQEKKGEKMNFIKQFLRNKPLVSFINQLLILYILALA